jgi:hypothetical protein
VPKGILTRRGFELNSEFYEGRIEPFLGTAVAVIYSEVRFTHEREIVGGGHVYSVGRVEQLEIGKI